MHRLSAKKSRNGGVLAAGCDRRSHKGTKYSIKKENPNSIRRICQAIVLWLSIVLWLGLSLWITVQVYQYQFSLSIVAVELENDVESIPEEGSQNPSSQSRSVLDERGRLQKDWNDALSIQHKMALGDLRVESSSNDDFFSACLILKDDNHWFSEWIAYHYHVLDLRHLILVSDPTSHSSPTDIVNRWLDLIQIEVWTDEDFLPKWIGMKGENSSSGGLWMHLNRQKRFYGQCLNHLKAMDRTWVLLTDTDEFVRVNPLLKPLPQSVRSSPGHVLSALNAYLQSSEGDSIVTRSPKKTLCLLAPRLQITSTESNKTETAPFPFNSSDLLTYRYLYHNGEEMKAGKNIIKLDKSEPLPKAAYSVHHILEHCPRNTPGETKIRDISKILQIQHYLGTMQQFIARDDPRDKVSNRLMQWHSRGKFPDASIRDDGMATWLDGFVEIHGEKTAGELLKNVGKVEDNPQRNTTKILSRLQNTTLVKKHMDRERQKFVTPKSFSACLLTMDDSHWLVEWLAYHYHTLPLRKLIFVQDPNRRTDSRHIFERWSDRMDIQEFVDDQFIPTHIQRKLARGSISEAQMHRYRQKFFYSACLKDLKSRNSTWVLLSDSDEFIRPNTFSDGLNAKVPTLRKPGCISRYIEGQMRATRVVSGHGTKKSLSCLYVPRIQIASKETSNSLPPSEEFVAMLNATRTLGENFERENFLTTRWFYHNKQEIVVGGQNLDGKNLVDVSQIDVHEIPSQVPNVHHVLPGHCPESNGGNRIKERGTWLSINHYLGTFEQFSFRRDPRDDIVGRKKRNYEMWSTLGQDPPADTYDEESVSWLKGFVDDVGPIEAQILLKDVGVTETLEK